MVAASSESCFLVSVSFTSRPSFVAAVLASSNFSGTGTSFVSSPATALVEVTDVATDEFSSADTVAIPETAIIVATATEPKATEVFLKAYLIVLLFFNDDITSSF